MKNAGTMRTLPYKAVSVLAMSLLGLALMASYIPQASAINLWEIAFPAFYKLSAVLLLGHVVLKYANRFVLLRWLGTLFAPMPNRSLGMLLGAMLAFYQLIGEWSMTPWDIYLLLQISFAFLAGLSLAVIVYHFIGYRAKVWFISYKIDSSRFDTFMGNIIASVFLGATFHALPNVSGIHEGATFPLLLGIWSIVITMLSAVLVGEKPKESRWWLASSIATAVIMMIVAAELVHQYFPAYWSFNGREYSASQALLSVELGILAGLVTGVVVRFYDRIAGWYLNFLLHKPFMGLGVNVPLRIFINVVVPFLPMLVVSGALLLAYAAANIYGTSIALLGMLSNVGVSMVIEANHLNVDKLPVSELERKKLALVSPKLNKMLLGFWQRQEASSSK